MIFDLRKTNGVLLAAHRGVSGGNIPCNSLPAFQAAIRQKAEIVELDADMSEDGVLFVQHPGMEKVHLRMKDSIRNFSAETVKSFVLSNCDLGRTQYHIPTLEEALLLLRGRAVVNIDKFWDHPAEISALIRRLGMEDQILIKSAPKPQYLDAVEEYAPDLACMPIVSGENTVHDELNARNINYIGTEVLFSEEEMPVASKEYVDMMHGEGKLVWANAIVYNYKAVLAAWHNDDVSVIGDPARGWGWLADRGFDIIQTDFLYECRDYLVKTGRKPE